MESNNKYFYEASQEGGEGCGITGYLNIKTKEAPELGDDHSRRSFQEAREGGSRDA